MDEKQAIARLKRGDLDALQVLVSSYQLQAVRAACLIVGDRKLAEDIVQSAFIRAAERIGQFDDRRSFGPWFLRSVTNEALKAAQRQKRMVSLDAEDHREALDLADPSPLPEEMVEAKETTQAIWQALQHLSPPQRTAVVLRYYLEMDENEMANQMKSPLGTVKSWLHAARHKLKRHLHPLRSTEPSLALPRQTCKEPESETGDRP